MALSTIFKLVRGAWIPQSISLRSRLPQQKGLMHEIFPDTQDTWELSPGVPKLHNSHTQTSCTGTAQSKSSWFVGLTAYTHCPWLQKRLLLKKTLPSEHPTPFLCTDQLEALTLLMHFPNWSIPSTCGPMFYLCHRTQHQRSCHPSTWAAHVGSQDFLLLVSKAPFQLVYLKILSISVRSFPLTFL